MSPRRPTGTPSPPRRRLTDGETAERVLASALQILDAEGVSVALDQLSMERVIAEANVSRASAYRRWPNRQDFLADVLVAAVERTPLEPESDDDIALLEGLVAGRLDSVDTEQGRRDLVVEGLRLATDRDMRRLLASVPWRNHLALAATHRSLPDGELKTSIGRALAEAERRFTEMRAEVFAHLPTLLGYRLVPPLTGSDGFRLMSSAAGTMMSGILLRAHADPTWLDRRRHLSPFGSSEPAPWSDPELHLVGVFLAHLEPDPTIEWNAARVRSSLATLSERADAARASRPDRSPRRTGLEPSAQRG